MDNLLREFHLNTKFHENAITHAREKGMKLNEQTLFGQPEAWDIMTEMIENGQYVTPPSTIMYRDKVTGNTLSHEEAMKKKERGEKVRELAVLPQRHRVVWNCFYQVITKRFGYLIHPLCVSYKSGESTRTVAQKLNRELIRMGKYKGVKCDLSAFFDSVPIEEIDKEYDYLSSEEPSSIWNPIIDCYHDNRVIVNGELVERYCSLRQGNPLGCFLADIILRDMDAEMEKYDVVYYRYSDDFILIGPEFNKAFKRVKEMLAAKGLKLNEKKTEYITNRQWFTFLGFKFKGSKCTVAGKTMKNICHKIRMETIVQCRNKKRALTKMEIIRAIDNIQYYFFVGCRDCQAGMAGYLFGAINDEHDIAQIDEYAKDCIRAAYTNRCEIYGLGESYGEHGIVTHCSGKNCGMNMAKAEDLPRELGWYSLSHMNKKYLQGKSVYKAEILKMRNGIIVD